MIRTRQLAPATAASAAAAIWLALLGLVTTPYLLHRLGASAYAVFALITIIVAYLSNLEFGFGHATVRFLAQARAREDRASEARIVETSLMIFLCFGGVAAAIVLNGASFVVQSFAHFPPDVESDAVDAVRLGAFVLALTFLSSFAIGVLQAFGNFKVVIASRVVFGTLASASAVAAAAIFTDVRAVVAAQVVVGLGLCAVLLLAAGRTTGLKLRPGFDRPTFRVMGGFSAFIFAGGLAYQAMIQGPPTVLAGNAPSDELAAFAVPALVLQQLTLLVTATSLSFLPFASAESASGDRTRLAAVMRSHVRLTVAVMGPISAFLIVFADPLLSAWVGSDFASQAAGPLKLLAGAALVLAISAPPADVARGLGRPDWVFLFTLVGAVSGILVALVAVGSLGADGAALGLLAGLTLGTFPFLLIVADRLLGLSARLLVTSLAGPIAAVLAISAAYWLGSTLASGLLGAAIVGLVATALYTVTVYRLVLDEIERSTLASGGQAFMRSIRAVGN